MFSAAYYSLLCVKQPCVMIADEHFEHMANRRLREWFVEDVGKKLDGVMALLVQVAWHQEARCK